MAAGGGGDQIVGYRYYLGVHMGLARGPLNEIVAIKVGDRQAWPPESEGSTGPNVWRVVVSGSLPEPPKDGFLGLIMLTMRTIWVKPGEGYKPYRSGDGGWTTDAVWDGVNNYWLFTPNGQETPIRVYVGTTDEAAGVDTGDPDTAFQARGWVAVNTVTSTGRTWTGFEWMIWDDGAADTAGLPGADPGGGTGGAGGGISGGGYGGGGGVGNGHTAIP